MSEPDYLELSKNDDAFFLTVFKMALGMMAFIALIAFVSIVTNDYIKNKTIQECLKAGHEINDCRELNGLENK